MAEANSKIYRAIVMEVRPRLQSVNAYILLKEKASTIDVLLHCNTLDLVIEGNSHSIPCTDINILPDSLTSLQINGSHVSFRFQTNTNPQDYTGRFKAEFLQPPQTHKYQIQNNNWLQKNVAYMLSCLNCTRVLSRKASFQRILPLPSENLDVSNWFCHGHSIDQNTNLSPTINDIFYTETYVHLALFLLDDDCVKVNKVIICKRCLSWIGLKVNDLVARVWFNSVGFKSDGEVYHTSPLSDVHVVTNQILGSSFMNSAKIVFHCQVNNTAKNYVLLWVIEKKLNLLVDISRKMQKCDVAKVLFKFEEQESDTVSQWQEETGTSVVNISKIMLVDLLKHLHRMNEFFPTEFRVTNGFCVSYLCLYDNNFV